MRTITLVVLGLLLGQLPALRAQEACKDVFKLPAVGKWVEYQALYDQKEKYVLRYAVVGEEKREGTDYRWLEMKMTNQTDPGKNLVYQMLVPGSLAGRKRILIPPLPVRRIGVPELRLIWLTPVIRRARGVPGPCV